MPFVTNEEYPCVGFTNLTFYCILGNIVRTKAIKYKGKININQNKNFNRGAIYFVVRSTRNCVWSFFGSDCDKVKPKSQSLLSTQKNMINVTYVSISNSLN